MYKNVKVPVEWEDLPSINDKVETSKCVVGYVKAFLYERQEIVTITSAPYGKGTILGDYHLGDLKRLEQAKSN